MESELNPCPFCGSSAEMFLGNFRYRHNTRCKSQIDALQQLEKYKTMGVVVDKKIVPTGHSIRLTWGVWVVFQRFTPRCSNKNCIASHSNDFGTEAEAVEAWNRRCPDGI